MAALYNLKHIFLLSFFTLKLIQWCSFLNFTVSGLGILGFSCWFGFVLYRWLKRRYAIMQIAAYRKAILITGCDSGFGHQLAKRMVSRGFFVFAGCLNPNEGGAVALKNQPNTEVVELDVTKEDHFEKALEIVKERLQENDNILWGVVANAGTANFSEFEWESMEMIQKMFDVNVFGVIRTVKTFLPLLRQSRGRIVITASLCSRKTIHGITPYSMTKHAVLALADGLRRECAAWDIDVCTVEPAFYRTNLTEYTTLRKTFMDKRLVQLPQEVRENYGEDYFRSFWDSSRKSLSRLMNNNINDVVDAMILALTIVDPEPNYYVAPTGQLAIMNIMDYLPVELNDYIMSKLMPICEPAAVKQAIFTK